MGFNAALGAGECANTWRNYFLGDAVYFASLDLTLPVTEIYRRVDNEELREFLQEKEPTQPPI